MSTADSAAAWRELMDAIDGSGAVVAELGSDAPEVDVVEGYRYVLNVLSDQLDRAAMRASARPQFLPGVTPVRKLFFDNPDTDYDTAMIRGDRAYRIRGRRGTSTYLAFCVYAGNITKGEPTRVANLSDANLVVDADGSFEVVLGSHPQPGNWIPLARDAHAVFARQYFLDRGVETPARYEIEDLDDPGPDPVFDAARFARVARSTAAFVTTATTLALRRAEQSRAAPNRFFELPGHGVYGTPDAGYVACWYELEDDEVLVIDVMPPECRYWGVHLANRWGQSLDHRTRRTSLNRHSATVAAARVQITVGAEDPDRANWLDTAGHRRGWILFRWLLAAGVAVPDARVERRRNG